MSACVSKLVLNDGSWHHHGWSWMSLHLQPVKVTIKLKKLNIRGWSVNSLKLPSWSLIFFLRMFYLWSVWNYATKEWPPILPMSVVSVNNTLESAEKHATWHTFNVVCLWWFWFWGAYIEMQFYFEVWESVQTTLIHMVTFWVAVGSWVWAWELHWPHNLIWCQGQHGML